MSGFVAVFVGGPLDGQRREIENPSAELRFPSAEMGKRTEDAIYVRRARFRMVERPHGEYRYDFLQPAGSRNTTYRSET